MKSIDFIDRSNCIRGNPHSEDDPGTDTKTNLETEAKTGLDADTNSETKIHPAVKLMQPFGLPVMNDHYYLKIVCTCPMQYPHSIYHYMKSSAVQVQSCSWAKMIPKCLAILLKTNYFFHLLDNRNSCLSINQFYWSKQLQKRKSPRARTTQETDTKTNL